MDIPLSQAIVCFDKRSDRAAVCACPDHEGVSAGFSHVVGACYPYWEGLDGDARTRDLLIEIWQAVCLLGVDAAALHRALLVVPEYRALTPIDALPAPYRT